MSASRSRPGSILGVLGPNGAGKTTAVRILTTLALPDAGRARVAGFDVVEDGRLGAPEHGGRRPGCHAGQPADRPAEPGDGGRAQRAAPSPGQASGPSSSSSDSSSPMPPTGWSRAIRGGCAGASTWPPAWSPDRPVLFLDEPTTGLDPTSRTRMWDVIRELVADGRHPPAHHPVPRGGGPAGRPHRGHRPRPGHRRRIGTRAQGGHRRRPARGDPQRAPRRSRRRPGPLRRRPGDRQ